MSAREEARLIEKLRAIEALYARPSTQGEQAAAANARERILERLRNITSVDEPVEYRFSMGDAWSRRVFVALLRRYGLRPYRYPRQRHTTVMVRVSERFVNETLWPEYQAIDETLRAYLDEVTSRVVKQVLHDDLSEATVEPDKQLSLPVERKPASAGTEDTRVRTADADPPSAKAANQSQTKPTKPESRAERRKKERERKKEEKRRRRKNRR